MRGDNAGVIQQQWGSGSIDSARVEPGIRGSTSPTFRWEDNTDPDILARVWDGTTTVFSVDIEGQVSSYTAIIYPATSADVPLVIQDGTVGTSNNWTEWRTSLGTLITWVSNAGIVRTTAEVQAFVANTDANPATRLSDAGIDFGPGGGSPTDVILYRVAADQLKTDDQFVATDGVTSRYIEYVGAINGNDDDFDTPPADGTIYTVRNTSNGKVYLVTRAAGAWKAVECT